MRRVGVALVKEVRMESTTAPKILAVHNERVVADTLTVILKHHGYDCIPAYYGDDAVSIARQIRPQVILIDVVMPGMKGTDAAMLILNEQPECKIIFFATSTGADALCQEVKRNGYDVEIMVGLPKPQDLLKKLCDLGFDPPIISPPRSV
jgi:CheY-like chemotaxis protein